MKRFTRFIPEVQLDGTPYEYEGELKLSQGGGGGGKTDTSPWKQQQPFLTDIFGEAQDIYRRGPNYYPTTNPIAGLSDQTQAGLDAMLQPGYAAEGIQNTVQQGLATTGADFGTEYDSYMRELASNGGRPVNGADSVANGIRTAQANSGPNYLEPTANVDAATALQGILDGENDPRFQEYMASVNNQISDNLIQNNLLPSQVQQMASGAYGGSSSRQIARGTADDIADTIGRNSNKLILDHVQNQLSAGNIVTGAQRGANDFNLGVLDAGIRTGQVDVQGDIANQSSNDRQNALALAALQGKHSTQLQQAGVGANLATTYNDLQYADAERQMQVGSVYDTREQARIDAEIARQLYDDAAPNRALSEYSALVNGGGSLGSSVSGGGIDPVTGAIGGATAAAGLIGMTGGLGTAASAGVTATAGWAGAAAAMGPVGWAALAAGAVLGSGILS